MPLPLVFSSVCLNNRGMVTSPRAALLPQSSPDTILSLVSSGIFGIIGVPSRPLSACEFKRLTLWVRWQRSPVRDLYETLHCVCKKCYNSWGEKNKTNMHICVSDTQILSPLFLWANELLTVNSVCHCWGPNINTFSIFNNFLKSGSCHKYQLFSCILRANII